MINIPYDDDDADEKDQCSVGGEFEFDDFDQRFTTSCASCADSTKVKVCPIF